MKTKKIIIKILAFILIQSFLVAQVAWCGEFYTVKRRAESGLYPKIKINKISLQKVYLQSASLREINSKQLSLEIKIAFAMLVYPLRSIGNLQVACAKPQATKYTLAPETQINAFQFREMVSSAIKRIAKLNKNSQQTTDTIKPQPTRQNYPETGISWRKIISTYFLLIVLWVIPFITMAQPPNPSDFSPTMIQNIEMVSPPSRESNILKEISERKKILEGMKIIQHPYFGEILYDMRGDEWWEKGQSFNYINGEYFLDGFTPEQYVANPAKTHDEMISMLTPLNPGNNRFSNFEAIEGIPSKLDLRANNVNADLGLQRQVRKLINRGIIGEDTFVIVSHGHFIAGLAELAKALTSKGEYMFDTAVYYPRGGWDEKSSRPASVPHQQFQLWAETVQKAKQEHRANGRNWAGGIAVALFGHRGDQDYTKTFGKASIDPEVLLGSVSEFKEFLSANGLKRVAILTEEMSLDPEQDNILPLDRLKEGAFNSTANEDLYDYMAALSETGFDIKVVSADTRRPSGYLAEKLADQDAGIPFDEKAFRQRSSRISGVPSRNIPEIDIRQEDWQLPFSSIMIKKELYDHKDIQFIRNSI